MRALATRAGWLTIASVCLFGAAAGGSGVSVALAVPPDCSLLHGGTQAAGGDRSNALNGNPSSTDWVRTNGSSGEIWVNPSLQFNNDCINVVQASVIRERFVDSNNNLTSAGMEVGSEWLNIYTSATHQIYQSHQWFFRWYNPSAGIDDPHLYNGALVGDPGCNLNVNDWPRFRVFNISGTRWQPEVYCSGTQAGWKDLYAPGSVDMGYTRGVAEAASTRYGGNTGLDDTFRHLQALVGTGTTFHDWSHTQCFTNSTSDYKWGVNLSASPQPAFDVFQGSQSNC